MIHCFQSEPHFLSSVNPRITKEGSFLVLAKRVVAYSKLARRFNCSLCSWLRFGKFQPPRTPNYEIILIEHKRGPTKLWNINCLPLSKQIWTIKSIKLVKEMWRTKCYWTNSNPKYIFVNYLSFKSIQLSIFHQAVFHRLDAKLRSAVSENSLLWESN